MNDLNQTIPPRKLRSFRGHRLPVEASLAGYTALIDHYQLSVPLPRTCFATRNKHATVKKNNWEILKPGYSPSPDLEGHLNFALKYEGIDLLILKRLFKNVPAGAIEKLVKKKKTGKYSRRIWFLYEWLLEEQLNIEDAKQGNYVKIIDPGQQFESTVSESSRRHRVKNNLPGTRRFCPLVFRSEKINEYIKKDLAQRAREIVETVPKDILSRSALFLLLKDSKSSFDIENEQPPQDRIQRWGRAIGQAGRRALDRDELLRLQEMVIGDSRLVDLGLRDEGGFVGERDRQTRAPIPDHISARPADLSSLINGLIEFSHRGGQEIDPVVSAAVLAFGFVYIHPFQDGNGRIHRYLIHHILAERGFNPPQVIFPVSSAIQDRLDEYKNVLESYSLKLLPFIEWEETKKHNVKVLNDTTDYYRYFDATLHAEFIYDCVCQTIEEDLPEEVAYLRNHDEFCERVKQTIDMPNQTLDLLVSFLDQNNGTLSKRARNKEFEKLTAEEIEEIEEIHRETFKE